MKGKQTVHVENAKASYDFELHRNITVIRGKSASGKTTLYDMIEDYSRRKEKSGVRISSSRPCTAITDSDWEEALKRLQNHIIFIDEGSEYISSKAFAKALQHNSNYFVLFTRENLFELPYSVREIYEISMVGRSRKKHCLKPLYDLNENYYLAEKDSAEFRQMEILLTEDSKSGYDFFRTCFDTKNIRCQSCGSKTKIFEWLKEHADQEIFVFADGAAFGSEIDSVKKWTEEHSGQSLICLPESFEWLLLKSGVIPDSSLEGILQNPVDFVDSRDYISWERYFTKLLTELSAGKPYSYTKKKLNPYYAAPANAKKIMGLIALDKEI